MGTLNGYLNKLDAPYPVPDVGDGKVGLASLVLLSEPSAIEDSGAFDEFAVLLYSAYDDILL